MVGDRRSIGTTLITPRGGVDLAPSYGPDSLNEHRKSGATELAQPRWYGIRHDVDVTEDLIATRQAVYSSPGFNVAMRNALVLQEMDIRTRNLLSDDDWRRIVAPTFVLWTTHDPTNPVAEGQRIADLIPGSKFVVMEHCGHWPQFEDAKTFNALHIDFLQGRWGGA